MSSIGFGEALRNARENLGLSVSQASSALRIRPDVIRALEDEDYSNMPAKGFARNQLSAYARFLGLNSVELTGDFLAGFSRFENGSSRRPQYNSGLPDARVSSRDGNSSRSAALRSRGDARQVIHGEYRDDAGLGGRLDRLPSTGSEYDGDSGIGSRSRRPRDFDEEGLEDNRPRTRVSRSRERGLDERRQSRSRRDFEDFDEFEDPRGPIDDFGQGFEDQRGDYGDYDYDDYDEFDEFDDGMDPRDARRRAARPVRNTNQRRNDRSGRSGNSRNSGNGKRRGRDAKQNNPRVENSMRYSRRQNMFGSSGFGAKKIVIVIVILAALGVAAYFLVPRIFGGTSDDSGQVIQVTGSGSDNATVMQDGNDTALTDIPENVDIKATEFGLKLTVSEGSSSWIQVDVDGSTPIAEVVSGPKELTYTVTEKASLQVGNTSGVTVTVDGQEVELKSKDGIGVITLTLKDGKVITSES